MTNPARSATSPSPVMLLEQLARHWSRVTAWTGGLRASDRDNASVANIHTGPMPTSEERLAPSCSLALGPATAPAPYEATTHVGVTLTAVGATQDQVLALLQDFIDTVAKPGGRPFFYTPRMHAGAFQLGGVIGEPPVAHFGDQATLGVFRVRLINLVSTPQILSPAVGEGGNSGGEISAQISIECVATPDTMPKPVAAFTVNALDQNAGTIRISGGELVLTSTGQADITINLSAPADDTIAELAAHNVAPRFSVTGLNGAVSARASLDLVDILPAETLESVGSRTVHIFA